MTFFGVLLSGCANGPPIENYYSSDYIDYEKIKHEVVPGKDSRIKSLGCDSSFYKCESYPDSKLENISTNYIYALIASNTYRTNMEFLIISSDENSNFDYKKHYRSKYGFAADLYESSNEIVISYRGTDDAADTLYINNFTDNIVPAQYLSANKLAEDIISKNSTNKKITVVGHSMGGGLALQTAIKHGLHAVVFNSSFKVWLSPEDDISNASWVEINDKHDMTSMYSKAYEKIVRFNDMNENVKRKVITVDFMNEIPIAYTKKSSRDHSIYYLARGMLLVASRKNQTAREILNYNVRCNDTKISDGPSEKT